MMGFVYKICGISIGLWIVGFWLDFGDFFGFLQGDSGIPMGVGLWLPSGNDYSLLVKTAIEIIRGFAGFAH